MPGYRARCKRGASVLLRCCSGVAPVLRACCSLVHPLYIPCTSLVHPLYIPCTSLVHPLYIPCTSLVQPLYIRYTSLGYPLRIFRNFGAATVLWRPILNSSFDIRWENCYGSHHGTANLSARLCEVLPDRFGRRSIEFGPPDPSLSPNRRAPRRFDRHPAPGDDADRQDSGS